MKYNALILIAVITVFSPQLGWGEEAKASPVPLQIGVILPLSGDSASIGVSIKNGMDLAYEKLPAAVREKFVLIYEDDQLNPARTVTAFRKLVNIDRIGALLTAYSGPSKAVASLSEQYRIPHLAIASDVEIVRGKKYVMNFWVTPEEEARTAWAEALRRGYRRIARITAIQQGFLTIKGACDRQNDGQVKIEFDEEHNPDIRDFKPFLAKLRGRTDLDAVLVLLMVNGQCGLFAKQAREMGLEIPLFNIEGFEDAHEQVLAQGALTGHWYVTNADPSGEFLAAYRKRYPQDSIFAAGNGHDAMLLLAAAAGQNLKSEALNRFLHEVRDFKGVLGTFSATEDNRFTLPAAVKEVTAN